MFAFVRPASATSISVSGDAVFTVNWLYTATNPDLSGSARFTISNFAATGFDLTIDQIENTTDTSLDIGARLTSFGLGLTPDVTGHSAIVDGDVFSWGFSNFPGFQQVDLCAAAGNNCAGGGHFGLNQGQSTAASDFMSIHVDGNFASGVTFSPVPVKFQTRAGSYEFDASSFSEPDPPAPVPEPTTLLMLGSGLALAVRRVSGRLLKNAAT